MLNRQAQVAPVLRARQVDEFADSGQQYGGLRTMAR